MTLVPKQSNQSTWISQKIDSMNKTNGKKGTGYQHQVLHFALWKKETKKSRWRLFNVWLFLDCSPQHLSLRCPHFPVGNQGGWALTWFGGKMKVGRKLQILWKNNENPSYFKKTEFISKVVLPDLPQARHMDFVKTD